MEKYYRSVMVEVGWVEYEITFSKNPNSNGSDDEADTVLFSLLQ